MGFGPYVNLGLFSIAIIGGMWFGRYLANMGKPVHSTVEDAPSRRLSNETDQQQLFVNTGVLYATIILVVGTVVSEWPPEGQHFPEPLEEAIFFPSVFITVAIFVRIALLIYRVESKQRLT